MNKHELLQLYAADERLKQVAYKLSSSRNPGSNGNSLHFHFSNLIGSSSSIVAAASYELLNHGDAIPINQDEINSHRSMLFVLNDKEEAAYFQNDLQHFIEKKDVLFLADSFRKPGQFDELNNSNVQLRTEVINRITNSVTKNELIVTYPEALMEKVVNAQSLRKSTLFIRMNEKLDEEFLTEMLVTYGFQKVDFVFEPGQFAIRGGILDIFSFGNELPYRVELFGEEVESIRVFDPLSQLSQKKISQVTIVPNIQTQFSNDEKVSLFDVLPENTVIWFYDLGFVKERTTSLYEKAIELHNAVKRTSSHDEDDHFNPAELFTEPTGFTSHLSPFTTVHFGKKSSQNAEVIRFDMEPQPSINKNFSLLIQYWKKLQKDQFTTLLFSDNKNQFNRLNAIFDDLKADVIYHPFSFAIKEGFVDREKKVACYTDHQIFERYHRYHLKQGFSKNKSLTIRLLRELKPGDFVTHLDHGIGVFSGLEKIEVNGQQREAVRLVYRDKCKVTLPSK